MTILKPFKKFIENSRLAWGSIEVWSTVVETEERTEEAIEDKEKSSHRQLAAAKMKAPARFWRRLRRRTSGDSDKGLTATSTKVRRNL